MISSSGAVRHEIFLLPVLFWVGCHFTDRYGFIIGCHDASGDGRTTGNTVAQTKQTPPVVFQVQGEPSQAQ